MKKAGFSLIEVLVSLLIIGISLPAAYQLAIQLSVRITNMSRGINDTHRLSNAVHKVIVESLYADEEILSSGFIHEERPFELKKLSAGQTDMITRCSVQAYAVIDKETQGQMIFFRPQEEA